MAFPTTALPVTVEIAPGADPAGDPGTWTWVDITSSVRLEDGIHITQGRGDEASRVDPSTCRLRLDNRSGNFTPRNPLGAYYGTLGRNTPLRVRLQWAKDTFTRTVSNGWGTADVGGAWTTTGGSASDYAVGGSGFFNLSSVAVSREASLAVARASVEIFAGHVKCHTLPTGANVQTSFLARYVDANNFVELALFPRTDNTVQLMLRSVLGGVQTSSGFLTVPGVTATTALSVRLQALGPTLRAWVWQKGQPPPSTWNASVAATHLAAGDFRFQSIRGAGNTNTSPFNIELDDLTISVDRFSGFVSSWPPRWDKSGRDATVPIEANGVLRRLGQGTPPQRSPVWRTYRAAAPVGYWPCEDGGDADRGASALAGHPPMTTSGTVTFEAIEAVQYVTAWGQLVFGTEPLPDLSAGGALIVSLPGDVSAACSAAGEWAMQCIAQTDVPNASGDVVLLDIATPGGTYVRWQVVNTSGLRERVLAYDAAGASTVVCDSLGVATGVVAHRVGLKQNGGNIDVSMWHGTDAPTDTGSIAGTLTAPTAITVNSTAATVSTQFPFGHLSVWDAAGTVLFSNGASDSYGVPVGGAMLSFVSEAAHDRITRLCAEDGVTVSMPAVSADFVTRMGSQPTGALLDLLYACAEADQGVIYESGFGLGYVPREQLYNRDTALALDFDQGQVAEPPEPTDDDQQLRNRVIVRRTGGSSAVAEDADSIAEVGLYQNEVSVNLADDSQLADHAAWRVHLGT